MASADEFGQWTASVPLDLGDHTLVAAGTYDPAGDLTTVSSAVTIVATAPASIPIVRLDPVSDSGTVGDLVTDIGQPGILVTADTVDTVIVTDVDTGIVLSGTSDGHGHWRFLPGSPLGVGVHHLRAVADDGFGDTASATLAVTVVRAPIMPAPALDPGIDTGTPGDGITTATLPVIDLAAQTGMTETLTDARSRVTFAQSGSLWTPSSVLTVGPHHLVATVSDAYGDSAIGTLDLTIVAPPAAPTVALDPDSDSGALGDRATIIQTPNIDVAASIGLTVALTDPQGDRFAATGGANGAWVFQPAAPLAAGAHHLTATVTDAFGNSAGTGYDLTITPAPVASLFALDPASDTGIAGDGTTTTDLPVLDLTAPAADVVSVIDVGQWGGSELTGTSDGAGHWTFTPTAPLALGVHHFEAGITDLDTGDSGTATLDITLTGTPPAPVVSLDPSDPSYGPRITPSNTPVIDVSAISTAVVTLTDMNTGMALSGEPTGDGSWSFSPAAPLTMGVHTFKANLTVPGLTVTSAATWQLTIVGAPASPVITGIAGTASATTDELQPTIQGTAAAGMLVTVFDGDNAIGGATATAQGAWSWTPTRALAAGSHAFTATASDPYAEASAPCEPYTAFIDPDAPPGTRSLPVDPHYYYARYGDVATADVSATHHYESYGWHEGRNPNAYFSTTAYLDLYPDVKAAGIDPLLHYDEYGWKEGRDPGPDFDTTLYLLHNPDVARARIDPLMHFLTYGEAEGRQAYPVIGRDDSRVLPGFDAEYYLLENPDVAASGMDPLRHFLQYGWKEGRNPDAYFNTDYYLARNPDVKASGMDPLLHFDDFGWKEGRNPSPMFDTRLYLSANPDVRAAGMNPLQHYLDFGAWELRAIYPVPGSG